MPGTSQRLSIGKADQVSFLGNIGPYKMLYGRSPMHVVVCGAFFSPLEGLDGLSLGAYWAERRADFPERSLLTAVLDNAEPTIEMGLPPLRSWMISGSEEYIVQLQQDRFYLNWRAARSQRYPRFQNTPTGGGIASLLAAEFTRFSEFCERTVHECPTLIQADLSKINTLVEGVHWRDFDDLRALLPLLNGLDDAIDSRTPEVSVQLIDQREWTTLINVKSGRELEGEKRPLIRLEIRARGALSHDSFDATFDGLNEQINQAFLRLIPRNEMIARFGGKQ